MKAQENPRVPVHVLERENNAHFTAKYEALHAECAALRAICQEVQRIVCAKCDRCAYSDISGVCERCDVERIKRLILGVPS